MLDTMVYYYFLFIKDFADYNFVDVPKEFSLAKLAWKWIPYGFMQHVLEVGPNLYKQASMAGSKWVSDSFSLLRREGRWLSGPFLSNFFYNFFKILSFFHGLECRQQKENKKAWWGHRILWLENIGSCGL